MASTSLVVSSDSDLLFCVLNII